MLSNRTVAITLGAVVIARVATVASAEAMIALLEFYDPDTVHAGEYGIDASEMPWRRMGGNRAVVKRRDNDDFVEGVFSGDEFHDTLQHLHHLYGRGDVVSITWSSKDVVMDGALRRTGVAVSEQKYGMSAHHFSVGATGEKFTVHYLSHQKTVKSDYFFDTFEKQY